MKSASSGLRFLPLALLAVLAAFVVARKLTARRTPPPIASVVSSSIAIAPSSSSVAIAAHAAGPFVSVTMAHGDPSRRHRSEAHGPRSANRLWRANVRGPIQGQVVTSPDEQTLYIATLGGELVALDRRGAERFAVALGDRAYGAPCVAVDGTIYVGSDKKQFLGVHPDGTVAFRLEVDGEADTACAVARGLVYFTAGSTLYAVRSRGDAAWRFRAKGKLFTAPAITDDGLVVVGSQDDHVYGVRDGKAVFAVDLGRDVDGAAVIADDGSIFVGTDAGEVVRLDASGTVSSRVRLGGYVRGLLALTHDGAVLAGTYGPTPVLARVDHGATAIVGAFPIQGTGSTDFGIHGGALEDRDGGVYFGAQDDMVYAVAPDGIRFRYDAGGDVDAPLTLLSDGSLIVASDAGFVDNLAP
ncbi:hypothetical protein BH09MYX1_BH09MYX1_65150 [soil metagenome]